MTFMTSQLKLQSFLVASSPGSWFPYCVQHAYNLFVRSSFNQLCCPCYRYFCCVNVCYIDLNKLMFGAASRATRSCTLINKYLQNLNSCISSTLSSSLYFQKSLKVNKHASCSFLVCFILS